MLATIQQSRIVHVPEPERRLPAARVSIPDLRVEENIFGEIKLVAGPEDSPIRFGICATRKIAEGTRDFFGGKRE